AGPHHCRRHARAARPARGGGNFKRRQRHDRHRPGRPCQTGWLHHRHRPVVEPCRVAGHLPAGLRRLARSAADFFTLGIAVVDHRQEALPPKTITELIAWMKARPEPTTFGTVGTGSAAHLCGLYFAQKTGLRLQYVPYRGAGPTMQDLIGGQIDLSCLEASSGLPYVQAGEFKAYGVMGRPRWAKMAVT